MSTTQNKITNLRTRNSCKCRHVFKASLHLENQKFDNRRNKLRFSPEFLAEQKAKQEIEDLNYITGFGINLTEGQNKALEAIQKLFSKTNYRGNIEPSQVTYSTMRMIPKIQITRAEYLAAYSVNIKSEREIERALADLYSLAETKYFVTYPRLDIEATGAPIKDAFGKHKKTDIDVITELIKLEKIYDYQDVTTRKLKYFIIEPSPIFIDQAGHEEVDPHNRGNYYILKPVDWREEIKSLGSGKRSKYETLFINWLMVKFEEIRRSGSEKYVINYNWETIASILKMPEITIQRNPKRVKQELFKACQTALTLKYIASYNSLDISPIVLNPEKFQPTACEDVNCTPQSVA